MAQENTQREYTGPAVAAYVDNTLVYHSAHEPGTWEMGNHISRAKALCQQHAMGVYAVAPHYRHKGKRAEIQVAGKVHLVSEAMRENQDEICGTANRLAWTEVA